MGLSDLPANDATARTTSGRHLLLLLATFTAAIFVSAALLFMVQPMFTKMVLPRLGGAPSVWSVAIVFFQGALLAGYAYAHWLTRYAPGRASIVVHLVVTAAAVLRAAAVDRHRLGAAAGVRRNVMADGPVRGLDRLAVLRPRRQQPVAAGVVRAHRSSGRERPLFPLRRQQYRKLPRARVLSERDRAIRGAAGPGHGLVARFRPADRAAGRLRRSAVAVPGIRPATAAATDAADAPPTWRNAAFWVALAAVPSGLLVAVTAHISTDVAAVPLLWVLPLALYLLTFVIVFARRPIIPHWLVVAVQPVFVIGLVAVLIFDPLKTILGLVAVHLVVFFVNALMCHGELARTRPAPRYLTGFYLWMATGGVVGGIAAGLIAPYVFDWVAEYPILLALALLCRPGLALPSERRWRILLFGGLAAAALILIVTTLNSVVLSETVFNRTFGALLIASVLFWRAPLPFAAMIAFVLLANHNIVEQAGAMSVRSFFGVTKVSETPDGQFRLLQHGTTLHGGQRIREFNGTEPAEPPELLMYYWDGSAISQAFDAVRARVNGPIRFAVIGLGAGSLACRAEPGDTVHFYEIDPAMIRIARDPYLFSFLWLCRPVATITLGDARLTLADAPDGAYDLIVVDAFSSDAIPIHLMTREAMAMYKAKLAPHGMLVMHISNRHLELASVVAGIAAANGLITYIDDSTDIDEAANPYKYSGTVAAVARSEEDFGLLAQSRDWELKTPDPAQWVWTDDYSNIVGAVLRKLKE